MLSPKDPPAATGEPPRPPPRVPTLEEIWSNLEGSDEGPREARAPLRDALDQRLANGRRQMMEAMLLGLLARRLGRELTSTELHAMKKRALALTTAPDLEALREVAGLQEDALLSWLLDARLC